jgi:hypothetical protein
LLALINNRVFKQYIYPFKITNLKGQSQDIVANKSVFLQLLTNLFSNNPPRQQGNSLLEMLEISHLQHFICMKYMYPSLMVEMAVVKALGCLKERANVLTKLTI